MPVPIQYQSNDLPVAGNIYCRLGEMFSLPQHATVDSAERSRALLLDLLISCDEKRMRAAESWHVGLGGLREGEWIGLGMRELF
jgi:hypothetical protein